MGAALTEVVMTVLARYLSSTILLVLLATPAFGQSPNDAASRLAALEIRLAALLPEAPAPAPPVAQDPAAMERRIRELELKIEQLLKDKAAPAQKLMNNEDQERTLEPVGLAGFYDNGYLVASSADGRFKYWLDGRANLDFATYRGSDNRLPTGFEVRRARIGVKTTLFADWLAEVDLDFADNAIEIKDLWVGYAGFTNMLIKAGNHKSPFGLESLTSSKNIVFIERPYIDSWAPDRLMGLALSGWGRHWQFTAGAYGEAAGAFNDKDSLTGGGAGTSQRVSFVGRVTVAPLNEKGRVLHFGVAAAQRQPEVAKIATSGSDLPDRLNASRIVKLDSRAETHVSRAKFISTGDMKFVDNMHQVGAEVAGVFGPMTFQGEWQSTVVHRLATTVANLEDHGFQGYYGQVTVFLTGESRPYFVSEGEFGRVVPTRELGAVEVGVRYSTIDLDDLTSVDAIKGGRATNVTGGITWFMNANHKLMANLAHVDHNANAKPGKDWAPLPTGTSTLLTSIAGDKFWTISLRYQLAF
jgi:phosphate-selective porin OprO/OprP